MIGKQLTLTAMTVMLLLGVGAPAWMAPDDFTWTGQANDNGNWIPNWTEDENWTGGSGYPDEDNPNDDDKVFINDANPQATVVQNVGDFTPIVAYLLVGDGHTLTLDHPLDVRGYTEFQGVTVLQGDGSLSAHRIRIHASQDTSVTFASGGGDLHTN